MGPRPELLPEPLAVAPLALAMGLPLATGDVASVTGGVTRVAEAFDLLPQKRRTLPQLAPGGWAGGDSSARTWLPVVGTGGSSGSPPSRSEEVIIPVRLG
jgi:hypothetical protein